MIVAQTLDGKYHKIDGLCNRGEWFGETWLIQCNIGVFAYKVIAEANNEQEAIDVLADSSLSNLIDHDEPCPHDTPETWNDCDCEFAGNDSHRIDTSYMAWPKRCKVLYFERPADWQGITAWGGYLERVE